MQPLNRRVVRNYLSGIGPTRLVLLLTTTGRKSGRPRVTPLQFENLHGTIYVASARGLRADWVRNIRADPRVTVQIGKLSFETLADLVLDAEKIADFLELRLDRHPLMIRLIMCCFEGLPWCYSRRDLVEYASSKALVALPEGGNDGKTGPEEDP